MPDKKLTDNEIIKALECCKTLNCEKCEGRTRFKTATNCRNELIGEVFDLINRQKAEVERLKTERDKEHDYCNHYARMCVTAKAEAYKEFAKRSVSVLSPICYNIDQYHLMNEALYNLVKEMVGE